MNQMNTLPTTIQMNNNDLLQANTTPSKSVFLNAATSVPSSSLLNLSPHKKLIDVTTNDSPLPIIQTRKAKDTGADSYSCGAILKNGEPAIILPHSRHFTTPTTPSLTPDIKPLPELNCARSGAGLVPSFNHTPGQFAEITKYKVTEAAIYKNPAILKNEVQDFSKLNRSDITELEHYHNLLSPYQANLLRSVQRKQQLYPQRYRDDYLRHSSILLLSNGWSSAQRYSLCSIPNKVNRSGQCRLHKYCPYCCFLERRHALARYVPCYDSGIWHFLTGSFTGDLKMTGTGDYYELLHYWDAYKIALQQLVKDKLIRGAFWTEELAVNSIAPVHVLPHIHATIEADSVDAEVIEKLNAAVSLNLKATLGPDHLAPNIQVKSLNSQRKLLSHLRYQVKPIKLVKAYDLAWSRALHNNRAGAVRLNSETTDLVLGYSSITNRRFKINYAGNLNPKTKLYIGVKAKDMRAAKDEVNALIREGVDYIEMDEKEAEGETVNDAADFSRN
jgi:hypothetical protein